MGRVDDRAWGRSLAVGLVAIWAGVVAISVVAPDLVSGSEQAHLPLAAMHTWIWGLVATIGFLWGMARLRGTAERHRRAHGLAIAVAAIWVGATVATAVLPVYVTGTDPTRLPVGAIAAPIAGALLTIVAAVVARLLGEPAEA